jgi:hypothetical protein
MCSVTGSPSIIDTTEIALQVEAGNDAIPDQNRAHEIAEQPLLFGNVGFEAILVVEEEAQSLALDDERVEGRQDVNLFPRRSRNGFDGIRTHPVQRFARPCHPYGYQLLATDSRFKQTTHRRPARRVLTADRFQTTRRCSAPDADARADTTECACAGFGDGCAR